MKTAKQLLSCLASLLLVTSGLQASSLTDWTGASDSSFTSNANWTNGAPNGTTDATIGTQATQPVLTGSASTANITIGDAAAVLQLDPGSQLYMTGVLNNSGTLSLAGSVAGLADFIMAGGGNSSVVNLGGQISMSDSSNNRVSSAAAGNSLTNNGHISGSGSLSSVYGSAWALNNNGVVTALSATGNSLAISSLTSAGSTNHGTLRAGDGTNVGDLTISNTTIDNTGGLIVSNAGSTVNLTSNTAINGGTMTLNGNGSLSGSAAFNGTLLNGAGTLQVSGVGTLGDSVTIDSATTVNVNPGSQLYAATGLLNNGKIQLSGNGAGLADMVMASGPGAVTNAGTISLSDHYNNRISANSAGITLDNSGTISGAGTLSTAYGSSWTLNNTGTVTALSAVGNSLNINSLTVSNTSTLQAGNATNVGELYFSGTTVNNAGGTILSHAGSTVTLTGGSAVNGGTLTGPGTMQVSGSATLGGPVTIASGATVTVNAGSQLYASGTGLLNNGTLRLAGNGSGYADVLMTGGPGTVTNTGAISLSDSPNNRVSANSAGMTLINSGTISGSGGLNADYGSTWALNNSGTVTALSASGNSLTIGGLTSAGSANTGTLQAGDGANVGALTISNTTINNAGGAILSNTGSFVTLTNSAEIDGGTLTLHGNGGLSSGAFFNGASLNGSGTLQVNGTGTLGGSAVIDSATSVNVNPAGTQLYAQTGLVNNGAIHLAGDATGYANIVMTSGPGTVTNAGAITLADHSYNRISSNSAGITLLNSGTISGSGALNSDYGSSWALNNTGTVTALSATGNSLTINNLAGAGSANTGTLQAGDGTNIGALTIASTTINNTGGTILSNTGSTVTLASSAEIDGGTLTLNGGGTLSTGAFFNGTSLNGSGTLQVNSVGALGGSVVIDAATSVNVNPASQLYTQAGLVNNGKIQLSGGGPGFADLIMTSGPGTVTNAGTISMADHPNNRISSNSGGITLLNSGTISGSGTLNSDYGSAWSLNNTGSIIANGANAMEIRAGGTFTNSGTLQATVGSQVSILSNTTFANFSAQTLTGGTYSAGGVIQFAGADVVNNAATIQMTSSTGRIQDDSGNDGLRNFSNNTAAGAFDLENGYSFNRLATFDNAGMVGVFAGSSFSTGASDYNQSAGTTQVDGSLTAANVNVNGGVLKGTGTVNANVTVGAGGHVAPGDSPGVLTANSYVQDAGGELDIVIGGSAAGTGYSVLDIIDTVMLNGILDLTSINSWVPFNGEIFDILHAGGGVQGTFASVVWANLAPGLTYSVIYNANNVEVSVSGGVSARPEPSTWLLIAGALAGLALYRRRSRAPRAVAN